MELAYLAEVHESELVLREVDGDTGCLRRRARVLPAGDALVVPRDGRGRRAAARPRRGRAPAGRRAPVRRRHRHPRLRRRAGAPRRRHAVRHALLPQPRPRSRSSASATCAISTCSRGWQRGASRPRKARPCDRRAEVEAAAGQALLAALNARENYTAAHSEAVLELALDVAAELGIDSDDATSVGQVALLHDIGKVGVPDAILQKPGRLTGPEWDVMREHPAIGAQIVNAIGSLSHLAPAVRAEHERWDGSGYPDGLAGEDVPLASRICFVCDAWHAMTSDRPYRRALTPDEARAELERHTGTQFCPTTVAALLRVLDRGGVPVVESAERRRRGGDQAAAGPPRPAAGGGAAGADHGLERRRRRAPVRGGARRGRGPGVQGAARGRHLDQPLGARAGPLPHARQRRRAQPRRGGAPGDGDVAADRARPDARRARRAVRDRARARRAARRRSARSSSSIGRGSALACPIRVGDRVWGVLEAYSAVGAPPFTTSHVRFAEALCAQVATAIGRAELFSRLESLAYEDPLTRLPNRRALDERLEEAVARALATARELSLLFCDLDGLKEVNDRHGHDAGDHALALRRPRAHGGGRGVPRLVHQPARRRRVLRGDGGLRPRVGARAGARRVAPPRRGARRAVHVLLRRRVPGRGAPPLGRPVPRRRRGAVRRQAGRRREAVRRRARHPDARDPVAGAVVAPALPRRRAARARGARPLPARAARRRPRRRRRAGAAGGGDRRVRRGVRRRQVGDLPPAPRRARGPDRARVRAARPLRPDASDVRFTSRTRPTRSPSTR